MGDFVYKIFNEVKRRMEFLERKNQEYININRNKCMDLATNTMDNGTLSQKMSENILYQTAEKNIKYNSDISENNKELFTYNTIEKKKKGNQNEEANQIVVNIDSLSRSVIESENLNSNKPLITIITKNRTQNQEENDNSFTVHKKRKVSYVVIPCIKASPKFDYYVDNNKVFKSEDEESLTYFPHTSHFILKLTSFKSLYVTSQASLATEMLKLIKLNILKNFKNNKNELEHIILNAKYKEIDEIVEISKFLKMDTDVIGSFLLESDFEKLNRDRYNFEELFCPICFIFSCERHTQGSSVFRI